MKKLAGIAVVCAFFGCARGAGNDEPKASETGGSEQVQAATPALPLTDKGGDCCQSCPLALRGVKLDYAEFGGGASMVFVTADKSEEEELRRRVAELAAYHNRNGDKLAMLNHPHRADVKPIEGGARIDLTPDSAFNMQSGFNREVEREVKWMQDGHCPPLGESNDCVSCDLPSR